MAGRMTCLEKRGRALSEVTTCALKSFLPGGPADVQRLMGHFTPDFPGQIS